MKISSNNAQIRNIVILTGAGISAESGIKTFRDTGGLWESFSMQELATPEAFAAHPERVYQFYNQRREQLKDANVRPNSAHSAIALLMEHSAFNTTLVTQNVDNLHERAGSKDVIHMHGELSKALCTACGSSHVTESSFDQFTACPICQAKGGLRPDIVWFGEQPKQLDIIYSRLEQTDLFVAIGTSGHVYPAAGFVQVAQQSGAKCIEINVKPSDNNALFDKTFYGPASQVVPEFVQALTEV